MGWTSEDLDKLAAIVDAERSAGNRHPWVAASKALGCSKSACRNAYARHCRGDQTAQPQLVKRPTEDGGLVVTADAVAEIKTVEQLIAAAQIDDRIYATSDGEAGAYQVTVRAVDWSAAGHILDRVVRGDLDASGAIKELRKLQSFRKVQNHRVSIKFRNRYPERMIEDLSAACLKDIREAAASIPWERAPRRKGKLLLELPLKDVHFGKLAWRKETGEDYDLKIATKMYEDAVDDYVARCLAHPEGPPVRSLYVVGSDFFHIDSSARQTTSGTPMDVDTRFHKLFLTGRDVAIRTILKLLKFGPVDVMVIPGNHDRESSFHLGYVLDAWFHEHPDVTIDTEPRDRKAYQWGVVGLMYTHGNLEVRSRLPKVFPESFPRIWANTLWREIHKGHIHSRQVKKPGKAVLHPMAIHPDNATGFVVHEDVGVIERTMPSLSAIDQWHYGCAWVGSVRGAEAYLWDRERALRDVLHHAVLPPPVSDRPMEAETIFAHG